MLFECKECSQQFPSRRSLHAHVKKHGYLLGDYYVKFYQRRDKLTGELLPYKNYEDYFARDFSHTPNKLRWLETAPKEEAKEYLTLEIKKRVEKHGIDYGPSELELVTANLPGVDIFKGHFGSYTAACKGAGVVPRLNQPLPKNFFQNFSKEHILIDTREKKPLEFQNSSSMKLDVGDYSVTPEKFAYTFVDRKSFQDFCGSVTASYDRFEREIERCKSMGCYLFILIEIEYDRAHAYNRKSYKKHNLNYVFGNMRKLQMKYPDTCQFVFGGTRAYSALLIPKLLCLGKEVWKTDIHYFWYKFLEKQKEKENNGLGGW